MYRRHRRRNTPLSLSLQSKMFQPEIDSASQQSLAFESSTNATILATLSLCGGFLAAFLIHVLVKVDKTPNYLYILNLVIAGLILAVYTAATTLYNIVQGGWAIGSFWCGVTAMVVQGTQCPALLSLAAASIDFYLVLNLQYYQSKRTAKIVIIGIWILTVFTEAGALYMSPEQVYHQISLTSSKLMCIVSFHDSQSRLSTFVSTLAVGGLIGFVLLIQISTNTAIFYKYFMVKRRRLVMTTLTAEIVSIVDMKGPLSAGEIKLLARSVALCGSNIVFGSPILLKISYEFMWGKQVSSMVDAVCLVAFSLFYISLGVWIVFYDPQVRSLSRETLLGRLATRIHQMVKEGARGVRETLLEKGKKEKGPQVQVDLSGFHWSAFEKKYSGEEITDSTHGLARPQPVHLEYGLESRLSYTYAWTAADHDHVSIGSSYVNEFQSGSESAATQAVHVKIDGLVLGDSFYNDI